MTHPRNPAGLAIPRGFEIVRRSGSALFLVRSDYKERLAGLPGLDPERLVREAAAACRNGAPVEDGPSGRLQAGRGQDLQTGQGRNRQSERGGDLQAERGGDLQSERGGDLQAERDDDLQAKRGGDRKAERSGDLRAERDDDLRARRGGNRPAGRGATARIAFPSGEALIVKRYRRGGLPARLLPDLFVGVGRMRADVEASVRAVACRVPCAPVVGLLLNQRFKFFYAAYLFTEEIPGVVTLAEALDHASPGWEAIQLAREAALVVRRLHDAEIIHRDLNLGNLLVREREVFVIDLDGAEILPAVSPARRFKNLSRLDRSYVKRFGDSGPLSHADRRELLETYCAGDAALLRELESHLSSHKRSIALHRLGWRE